MSVANLDIHALTDLGHPTRATLSALTTKVDTAHRRDHHGSLDARRHARPANASICRPPSVSNLSDAITSGVGSLVDADMNQASTKLKALQTQQQLGIQSLGIANQNSQLILKLFG